ncbi:hypothetical protein [Helicobacter sp. 11S03491-1]|uniref:hypothetical protein n=1 Tax=Helicobacter sp. 11S03491-1 TaxID=1476196 RepID=UPI000BA5BC70|nr:hypothetical protein [Helicobacter sp. 11S03491-1]PAF41439.1 hypothetical protein BKH45_06875 [Helicobacter sp. 11S03491-1]
MSKNIKKLNITYSGDGIINGEMDLESFSASILNFAKAMQVAKKYLDIGNLDIKIMAAKEGSFEVDLAFGVKEGWEALKGFFNSEHSSALANFLTITGSVFALFKFLKGKEPKETKEKGDKISITNQDNISLEFNPNVFKIYQDSRFGEYIEKFSDPLYSEEIKSIKIQYDEKISELLKTEREFYTKPFTAKDPNITRRVYTQTFGIASLNFQEGKKWKLFDGRGNISVFMKDESFLKRIANNEIDFAKGDKLVCEMELIEDLSEEKIKSSYYVLEVKQHIKTPRSVKLPGF